MSSFKNKSEKRINHELVTQNNLDASNQMISLWRAKKDDLKKPRFEGNKACPSSKKTSR